MLQNLYFLTGMSSSGVPGQAAAPSDYGVRKGMVTRRSSNATTQVRDTMSPIEYFKANKNNKKQNNQKNHQNQTPEKQSYFQSSGQVLASSNFHSQTLLFFFLFRVSQLLHKSLHYTLAFHTK